ncbi:MULTISPECIES: exonuclease subunit SbcD [Providencia]|uniref:Nuclease SbcCD subunit D n=2 Tax=Providencia alcalifaciens TaxID=126385 RepID=A0AAW9VA17_9GAMM|nr:MULTISPECIES: exonuclease subunit SbcD [Providencia]ETT04423.1 nuclease sbcCD subunit D [Providencia alcalifaciens F90-2004]EUC96816.1 nuclease sbcCD subunit D [Providencia alcalifaciens PAL-2]EUD06856.1 nuclease sbcCD subunit D [Providencia alcalifaciens R90-1475]EUD10152.1 nuclease sbcCD subunit D [Providencia alcalifaciens 205/92]MBF0691082.1 exonuclease subunit SbcD [Providencia alcalifaciens]
MRIIHTSDWHLGQYFFTKNRASEHQHFLLWLIEQIKLHQVDALIVAGDVFDTGAPPSYARELYNQFIVDLQRTNCQLVILSGNHDSVSVLNESSALLRYLNTHVITSSSESHVITLKDKQGNPTGLVCAIPFLRPRDVQISMAGQSSEEKQLSLQNAIRDYYQTCYQKAVKQREALGLDIPIIATGHLTVIGAELTDSVREIYIGTLDAFPSGAFPPADYIALGHIHRPQLIGGKEYIRYSGSPIALSFDESQQQKSVCLVEFKGHQFSNVTLLPIPVSQPLYSLKGTLKELQQQLMTLPTTTENRPTWLDIEVASQDYLGDIQQRIEALTQDRCVEVVRLRRARRAQTGQNLTQPNETLSELTAEEVFSRRLAEESLEDKALEQRLLQLFKQSYATLRTEQGE